MQQLFVLFLSPGPSWDRTIGFMEQPGAAEHVAFMRSLTSRGLMVLGGPFDDGDATTAVSMAVIVATGLEEARRIAGEDRSVEVGLLRVQVRPWNVPEGLALGSLPAPEGG